VLDGFTEPSGEEEIWGSYLQPKHAIENCSQIISFMPTPGKYIQLEKFHHLPNYSGANKNKKLLFITTLIIDKPIYVHKSIQNQ